MSRPFAPRRSAWHAAVAAMALAVAASALNASPASASASRSASAPATAHPRRAHVGHDGTRRRLEAAAAGTDDFQFWVDYPGSPEYAKKQPKWYDPIETRAGSSFVNTHGYSVSVACGEHGAIHLYADPAFNKGFDDKIRAWNPGASDSTGLLDRCGWPNMTSDEAPAELQYHRQTEPLMEDFSGGLDPETIYVARVKGCCEEDKYATNKYAKNINVVKDAELGKNVLAMTAWNMDDPNLCPGPKCHKIVKSTGAISTAGLFGSGRYEVIAKVPASLGLVWAVWTFHYEEHLPSNCADFTCWCNEMPSQQVMVQDKCEFRYDGSGKPCKYATVCDDNTDGWAPTAPPPPPAMTPAECGALHAEADPQFLGNSTFGGWATTRNDEVDIEIPANCASTKNAVCDEPGSVNGSWTCTGQYNTLNMVSVFAWCGACVVLLRVCSLLPADNVTSPSRVLGPSAPPRSLRPLVHPQRRTTTSTARTRARARRTRTCAQRPGIRRARLCRSWVTAGTTTTRSSVTPVPWAMGPPARCSTLMVSTSAPTTRFRRREAAA